VYYTVNYLLAAYLQTEECGNIEIAKTEKIKNGRAKFYFNITPEEAEKFKVQFHDSICYEFESKRKKTISLAYD